MNEKLKTLIKNNKTTILVSVCASVLTVAILVVVGGIILAVSGASFPSAVSSFLNKNVAPVVGGNGETVKTDTAAEESRIIDVVEKASPAVVSIVITKDVPIIEQYYQEFDPFGDDFFNDFFGNNGFRFRIPAPQQKQNGTEKREVGGGSGFFISSDGYIVTNKHVVDDDKAEYTVLANDGKKYDAEILAKDSALDVAILKVKGTGFPYLSFGDSDKLKPGQTVIAIGNALAEFRNSVSVGVVSGLSRSITAGDEFGKSEQLEGVIQTDAAINPGNSGGPLLDIKGNVIGVNVAVSRGAENIGFALTSNTVKGIADSVKKHGEIVRPYLGVRYVQITENLKKKNNLTVDYGVLVSRGETAEDLAVIPGSPADKAGIVENDIILEVDGVKLEQGKSLASIIRQKQIGDAVKLKILHKGSEKTVEVKLEKAPKSL
ncbi:MAG TPA: trypsin-like peptidase domain-containing protein [Candidatus Pacearchaeota archaeon]|nr:trypsin-like peptidase domain-containing protein [Candidatus Pacearchaeota archaeon]HQI26299.1 trypsin-like peptidase domain-containing protein [Candidatus Paceibacterota bacterium]